MKTLMIAATAILIASPVLAQNTTSSRGASKYAPGQEMQNSTKSTGPGASEYAPGHQRNTAAGPGHSESAPGQKMQTTTGANTKSSNTKAMTGSSTNRK
ncbi:hypothetical protein JQ604_17855 [Bradyrhizobium jicamae]|uniref:hypothetical protein n=1 Tax=Bradyrhizobium jicamae TaxID=280332 RepID=UPI001BA704DF|nr:hypothetical protein [Bradyrhizobium jicamae]MBR0754052.1 hypothetical protein [Bradyrhizobium jicamae]